jgi:ATP-dependent protease LonB
VANAFLIIQFAFSVIIGLYFLGLLKSQQVNKSAIGKESNKEIEKLRKLREIKLTEPLTEKTRPSTLDDIVGQEQGLKALRAALCGPNPQHIIIYGPPGVGKTAAARVVLEEAKRGYISPFNPDAKFVEVDASTLRFDERGIADPLIGSVHDPIYQGAGAYGVAGIPQPKPGAVTKAHGGVLFLDEIGELHPIQMNKLLKVLEDRKVFLESSYYNTEDTNIPSHIHEIFQKGYPADFRLVGATTRSAEEISPALRSRCVELFFRPLYPNEVSTIAKKASIKGGFRLEANTDEFISRYAQNGRDAVNIIQMAGGIALVEGRNTILKKDIEWVIEFGHYSPRIDKKASAIEQIGCMNGLAVLGTSTGILIDVEVSAIRAKTKNGTIKIAKGECCCFLGTSGSGKSTLLNLMAGLEKPTRGSITIHNMKIHKMNEKKLTKFRQENVGFVFQSYNLMSTLTAQENVSLPLTFKGISKKNRNKQARKILSDVGLETHLKHKPTQMSGGQQQRVGIARAFVGNPRLVFADEPTGNLDTKTTKEVMDLITKMAKENNQTLIIVTHDIDIARYADRIFYIIDGRVEKIETKNANS